MNSIVPVDPGDFLTTFFAAAGVILSGVGYALLYAGARLRRHPKRLYAAWAAFALLSACVLILMKTAHLTGIWLVLTPLLLLGYLAAPPFVLRLCHRTHDSLNSEHSP